MRSRPFVVVAAALVAFVAPLVSSSAWQTNATASGSDVKAPDALAVKVWADPGPYVYRDFRVWFELKDTGTEPDRFQMRVRRDGPRLELTDWNLRRFVLPMTGVDLEHGRRGCIQVRAKDGGVVGPWSRTICRIGVFPGKHFDYPKLPRDDRQWFKLTKGNSAFGGTVLYTDDFGARAFVRDLHAKRIKLWGLRCGNCGRIEVAFDGRTMARIDLSARKRHSDLIWQHEFHRPKHGRLTMTVLSDDGRLVQLDAAAVERDNRLSR